MISSILQLEHLSKITQRVQSKGPVTFRAGPRGRNGRKDQKDVQRLTDVTKGKIPQKLTSERTHSLTLGTRRGRRSKKRGGT